MILLSHSLGCPYTHYFLSKMSQDWKDTHIKVWITLAGAWAGAAKLMRIYASGTSLGLPDVVLEPLSLRPVLRTYESSAFLLPSKDFWSVEEVRLLFLWLSLFKSPNFNNYGVKSSRSLQLPLHLKTVPTIVTAHIFCACQGSHARPKRNAQHAGHADWFCLL